MFIFDFLDKTSFNAYYKKGIPNENQNITYLSIGFGRGMLDRFGMIPTKKPTKVEIFMQFMLVFSILSTLLFWFLYLPHVTGSFNEVAGLIQTVLTLYHGFMKYIAIKLSAKKIANLVFSARQFWRIEELTSEEQKPFLKMYFIQHKIFQGFFFCGCFTVLIFMIKPLFGMPPMLVWIPPGDVPVFCFIIIVEALFFYSAVFVVIGIDLLFVAMCTNLKIQFQILHHRLLNLDYGQYYADGKSAELHQTVYGYARYHKNLLKYAQDIEITFNKLFMMQYLLTVVSSCAQLALLNLGTNVTITDYLNSLTYLISLIVQFALYCYPLDDITSEAFNIANSIFYSSWYMGELPIRKILLFMIMRCQLGCYFTASGMVYMNRETFTKVFHTALSFLMFVKNLVES